MTIFPELEEDLRSLARRSVADQPSPGHRTPEGDGGGDARRRRRPRLHGRRLAIFAGCCVLAGGGAATAAVLGVKALLSTAPAGTLFRADPQVWNQFNHDHPPADGVIQQSVKEVETLTVPRVAGRIQYWVARTRDGGSCEAFKLPDGTWAGTSDDGVRYDFGGIVPGCHVPNRDGNVANGGGFDFDEDSVGPSPRVDPRAASDFTFIVFGTVDVRGAVRVRDMRTGRTAPIVDGEFFAIERPARTQVDRPGHPPALPRFQALSRSGTVLSTSWTQQQTLEGAAIATPSSLAGPQTRSPRAAVSSRSAATTRSPARPSP